VRLTARCGGVNRFSLICCLICRYCVILLIRHYQSLVRMHDWQVRVALTTGDHVHYAWLVSTLTSDRERGNFPAPYDVWGTPPSLQKYNFLNNAFLNFYTFYVKDKGKGMV